MPLYDYSCLECRAREPRVAGLDDHTALCVICGGIILRVEADIFQAYFAAVPVAFQAGKARLGDC